MKTSLIIFAISFTILFGCNNEKNKKEKELMKTKNIASILVENELHYDNAWSDFYFTIHPNNNYQIKFKSEYDSFIQSGNFTFTDDSFINLKKSILIKLKQYSPSNNEPLNRWYLIDSLVEIKADTSLVLKVFATNEWKFVFAAAEAEVLRNQSEEEFAKAVLIDPQWDYLKELRDFREFTVKLAK